MEMEKGRRQRRLRLRRAWLCGLQVEDGGGDSRGDVTKRLREVAGALEMKRRGGTAAGATRLCNSDRHRQRCSLRLKGGKRRWQRDRCVSRRNYGSESKMGRNIISVGGAGEGRGSGGKRVEQQDRKWAAAICGRGSALATWLGSGTSGEGWHQWRRNSGLRRRGRAAVLVKNLI
ncbi:hypothetical protein B296_00050627 [Ensete ventricosum]|uniref:Uncharacterized protein n=1 Tax=Ensete ventricosum TaxID=4639 RepID=A0A426YKH3_ENSVE|nr:hypothetical protein B296_00050627 [Ensete ventricosum]